MEKLTNQSSLQAKAELRVAELEEAILQLESTRRHLQMAATEAKSQIQSAISRQLHTLRSREVWLRNQVEVIQQAKEDILHTQEDELNKALGALTSCLQDDPQDSRLQDHLARFENLELKPEESPHVSFRADMTKMREAMHGFGKVESRHLPLETAFMDPQNCSTSLPRVFEDYEDPEHHVLYKTIEELKRGKQKDKLNVVQVSIPKLSPKAPWLIAANDASLSPSPSPTSKTIQFDYPPFTRQLSQKKGTGQHGQGSSIQQWLTQIQHHVETEEDGFEYVSPSISVTSELDSLQALKSKQSEPSMQTNPMFSYFKTVRGAPADNWLSQSDHVTQPSPSAAITETMRCLNEVTNSNKNWLMQYKDKQAFEKDSGCGSVCSSPKMAASDGLDNLRGIQKSVTRYFDEVDSKMSTWLGKSGLETRLEMDPDAGKVSSTVFCPASVKGQSLANCQRSTAYFDSYWESVVMSPAQKWLLKSKNPALIQEEIVASPLLEYFRTIVKYPESDWLLAKSESVKDGWEEAAFDYSQNLEEMEIDFPIFAEYHNASTSQWLHRGAKESDRDPEKMFGYFSTITTEPSVWLKEECPSIVSSEWLFVGKSATNCNADNIESSLSSLKIGQYAKKAWENKNPWLLQSELPSLPSQDLKPTKMMNEMFVRFHADVESQAWLLNSDGQSDEKVHYQPFSMEEDVVELEEKSSEVVNPAKPSETNTEEPDFKEWFAGFKQIQNSGFDGWLVNGQA